MNIATAKKAHIRIKKPSIQNLGIIGYGENNIYPQELLNMVSASETAVACRNRKTIFIEGNGFKDINFSETVLNNQNETADDILRQISEDAANYNGFAIHINYNVFGEAVAFAHMPFENCRLCEPDDAGYIGKIAVHPDWTGKLKRKGIICRVDKTNIDYINIYNPNPKIVIAQIEEAGGIELYKGQILWVGKGKQTYPIPIHDAAVSFMSTEEGLGNIINRNARNGFNPSAIFVIRKGLIKTDNNDEGNENKEESRPQILADNLNEARGDENTGNLMVFEIGEDEDMPQLIKMQGNNYDKDFITTTKTCEEKIYAIFNQEIFYRIRQGSIGFSADIIREAYEYYSSVTGVERRMIERAFDKLFKNTTFNPTKDFTIKPLIYENINKVNSL